MTYGLWLSAAGLQGNQYRQAVMANNMANVDTVGFKKDLAIMRERPVESLSARGMLYQSGPLKEISGGTHVSPTHHSFVHRVLEASPIGSTLPSLRQITAQHAGRCQPKYP